MSALHHLIASPENFYVLNDVVDLQQSRLDTIIQICRQISDLVGQINNLGLERRPLVQKILSELPVHGRVVVTRVFDDSFARSQGQV